jgi:hypothetical protein
LEQISGVEIGGEKGLMIAAPQGSGQEVGNYGFSHAKAAWFVKVGDFSHLFSRTIGRMFP